MFPVPIADLERALPDYLIQQRWYRAKAKNILQVHVAEVIAISAGTWLVIAQLRYQDGDEAHYLLPLASTGSQGPVLAGLHDALQNPDFRQALLDAISCERAFAGEKSCFSATRTSAFTSDCKAENLSSSLSRAEQSNSSIIFEQKYILKLFRKLEPGINPDIEVGTFLTERGFANIPAVFGTLECRLGSTGTMQAGILMQFVPNEGDAWKYTLQNLESFFAGINGEPPQLATRHPLELQPEPAALQRIGPYIESARLLAQRTAEMHTALTDENAGVDFAPERFTSEFAERLNGELLNQADITFNLLRDKSDMLAADAAEDARSLLDMESAIRRRLTALEKAHIHAVRIRHHGDYHLGQVLWTGRDFMIIDFEGEPARPLADRRIKTFAMRDVAGIVRSFSYAGYAAIPPGAHNRELLEMWADFWGAIVSAEYLRAYLETANGAQFVGSNTAEHRLLFDAFLLQKALYEVAYELNNRPDWVRIPLRGILNLAGERGRRTQVA